MKIMSIEKNSTFLASIKVCVLWDKEPEKDDEYDEEKAAEMILNYVNSKKDTDEFEFIDYNGVKIREYEEAVYGSKCEISTFREHWIMER